MEEWRDIVEYEGYYQVSNCGRVRRIKNSNPNNYKIISPCMQNAGYLVVNLCKNNNPKKKLVHRLVAMAFIGNPNNYEYVNHKDENKCNNHVNNLEWCTKSYNAKYYLNYDPTRKVEYAKRFKDSSGKSLSPMTKHIARKYTKLISQYSKDMIKIATFRDASEVREKLGFLTQHIIMACETKKKNGMPRVVYGYIWEYEKSALTEM